MRTMRCRPDRPDRCDRADRAGRAARAGSGRQAKSAQREPETAHPLCQLSDMASRIPDSSQRAQAARHGTGST
eukprot:1916294-Rhodomonas_salina.4